MGPLVLVYAADWLVMRCGIREAVERGVKCPTSHVVTHTIIQRAKACMYLCQANGCIRSKEVRSHDDTSAMLPHLSMLTRWQKE